MKLSWITLMLGFGILCGCGSKQGTPKPSASVKVYDPLSYHHFGPIAPKHKQGESWGCAGTSPTYLGPREPSFEEVSRHADICERLLSEIP